MQSADKLWLSDQRSSIIFPVTLFCFVSRCRVKTPMMSYQWNLVWASRGILANPLSKECFHLVTRACISVILQITIPSTKVVYFFDSLLLWCGYPGIRLEDTALFQHCNRIDENQPCKVDLAANYASVASCFQSISYLGLCVSKLKLFVHYTNDMLIKRQKYYYFRTKLPFGHGKDQDY